jgi:hypothetical protein
MIPTVFLLLFGIGSFAGAVAVAPTRGYHPRQDVQGWLLVILLTMLAVLSILIGGYLYGEQ